MKKLVLLVVFCVMSFTGNGQSYCTPHWYYSGSSTGFLCNATRHLKLDGAYGSIDDGTSDTSAYVDNSSSMIIELLSGSTYTISIGTTGSYSMDYQIWIDLNSDGTFASTESVGGVHTTSSGTGPLTFTIPSGSPIGTHRMRVEAEYSAYHSYPHMLPCPNGSATSSYYGDVRDYSVIIDTLYTALSVSPSSLTFPTTYVGATSTPQTLHLSGSYLVPATGSITVSAPAGFEILSGSSWVNSYTIGYTGGALTDSVSVRFVPGSAMSYGGSIALRNGASGVLLVPVSGTGLILCSGTPTAGAITPSSVTSNASTSDTLTDVGYSSTAGITFQWQISSTGTSFTDITGATSPVYIVTGMTTSTYYKCKVTCSASGVSVTTAPICIIYAVPCSGTPSASTAVASSSYCASCNDTLSVAGYSGLTGLDFQWQKSPNGTTGWSTLAPGATDASYSFVPSSDNYYRCAVSCVSSSTTIYSGITHIVFGYRIVAHQVTDSVSSACGGPKFHVTANSSSPLLYVTTFYGDGQKDSIQFLSDTTVITTHYYSHSGSYSIKQILYNNNIAQDSIAFTYNYFYCRTLPISYFADINSNGMYDTSDHMNNKPVATIVDSNGVTIDTIVATSGFYYPVSGPVGTVYTFTAIAPLGGALVSCPSSGIVRDTIVSAVNTYARKYFGLACSGSGTFNLTVHATLVAGRHAAAGLICIENWGCSAQSPVVTLVTSPKYVYRYSNPAPTTVSASKIIWNLSAMDFTSKTINIGYMLTIPSGTAYYTPGDTVHSSFSVSPETGDSDTTNNHNDRLDTIRSSYDPNFIQSTPSGHILAGTLLHYSVGFENDGNDTAQNIYVLDTLSGYLDAATFRPVFASNEMYLETQHVGGLTIVKFDFPGIKLLDSTHHGYCDGAFQYDIRVKDGVPDGTVIPARVGIYFDDNEVVMTNEEQNIIGFPSGVQSLTAPANEYEIYPNPATNELTVKMEGAHDASVIVSNSMGTTVLQQDIHTSQTKLNIKALPAGIYYIKMTGAGGSVVKRFVKM